MTGEQLKALQSSFGWSNKQLADFINEALGRKYDGSKMSQWRNNRAEIPAEVAAFLNGLNDSDPVTDLSDFGIVFQPPEDTAPGSGRPDEQAKPRALALASSGVYSRTCEEFFELIATGIGMVGAAVGNSALQRDGLIIHGDKRELGRAWGKLAETNETFRRLIEATDKQGAYLAVALTTGLTIGKVWRNHAIPESPPDNLHGYATDEPPPASGPTLVHDAASVPAV